LSRPEADAVSASPLIALRGVERCYGEGEAAVRALAGVDLTITAGEFTVVMGPSGSGKSTCMNIIGALDKPTAGACYYRGVDIAGLDRDQLALLRRHELGFIFQSFNLLPRTSALDNVMLPLVYQGVPRRERLARAQEALAQVGLADRAHHGPAQLSGGQQQRVAIARAIASAPGVILADEPTGNLDSARSAEIMGLLAHLNAERGLTILVVTHEPEIARWARRALWFCDGRVAHDGPPEAVLAAALGLEGGGRGRSAAGLAP
jgi:putative ABC transport system ATP-binding protein